MDVRNCKICGRLFDYTGSVLCPVCNQAMEKKFVQVKEYIRENPKSSLAQISEENEVPVQQLKKWIKEERLSFTKDSGITLQCEKCGASILTGRYCANCKKTMTNKLEGLYTQEHGTEQRKSRSDGNGRMRFLK